MSGVSSDLFCENALDVASSQPCLCAVVVPDRRVVICDTIYYLVIIICYCNYSFIMTNYNFIRTDFWKHCLLSCLKI